MDEQKNETVVEEEIGEETPDAELTPETDWKAEAEKARGIAKRALTKLKKLGEVKKVEAEAPVIPAKKDAQNAGGLDETQLDYLDLKGVTADEDVKIIEDIVKKTGQTVRQALKDDYVVAKLKANQDARAVKDATPGSTKRSGSGTGDSLELAVAKYEQSGYNPANLPSDFALRTQVINAIADKSSQNQPSWRR